MFPARTTRRINVGSVAIGGGAPVSLQSMTNTNTADAAATLAQIRRVASAGCDIIRCAVPDEAAVNALPEILAGSPIPVIGDIHFDYRLALGAIRAGIHGIRINPGNIGGEADIRAVADCIRAHGICVRVGSNTGSIEKTFLEKYGKTAPALVESALANVAILEKYGVSDIVISVKASSVPLTVEAYTLLRQRCGYPLHLGVTEAGTRRMGIVKSSVGIGSLLLAGIGETIRVSLSDDPVREVYAAHDILRACGLEKDYVEVVACPTCGRCRYDCIGMAARVEERVRTVKKRLKVAVMGCVVNGPGEAAGCDLGIAGGETYCVLMQKGRENERVSKEDAERVFFERLEALIDEK